MNKDKCIIIKESELEELRKKASGINIEFTAVLREIPQDTWVLTGFIVRDKIISEINCNVSGETITIEGKLLDIINTLKDSLNKTLREWIKDYIDKQFLATIQNQSKELKDIRTKSDYYYNKIKEHNKKCWFSWNKIKI